MIFSLSASDLILPLQEATIIRLDLRFRGDDRSVFAQRCHSRKGLSFPRKRESIIFIVTPSNRTAAPLPCSLDLNSEYSFLLDQYLRFFHRFCRDILFVLILVSILVKHKHQLEYNRGCLSHHMFFDKSDHLSEENPSLL